MIANLGAATELSVRLVAGPAELHALAREVDDLALAMRPRAPFATSAWLQLWWQHFRETGLLVRDRFFVHALRDANGALIALAPLVLTQRPGTGRLGLRVIAFWGGDKNITELRGLLCAPEHEAAATHALLTHLLARRDQWDWLVWDGVRPGSEAHAMLSRDRNFRWSREVASHPLALPRSWEEFRTTRSRNIKESLRKCYNSLKREQLSFDFQVVERADELPAALQRMLALHALRARAKELADHADYLNGSPAEKLLHSLARTPEQAPRLRVLELRVAGALVASRLAFLLEDELYLYFSGFDPAWARYSVMTTAVAETIKWAIARGVRSVNLSTGSDVSKARWGPTVSTTCAGILTSPTRGAALKRTVVQQLERGARGTGPLARALTLVRRRG